MEYKESEQTKFSTFATTYIKNSFADYFRHIKRQKRAALYQRETDRNQENDNLEESLKNLEAENTGEDSLSYQLLRLDLERDLLRERRKLRKSEKSTAAGLEILYAIFKGSLWSGNHGDNGNSGILLLSMCEKSTEAFVAGGDGIKEESCRRSL